MHTIALAVYIRRESLTYLSCFLESMTDIAIYTYEREPWTYDSSLCMPLCLLIVFKGMSWHILFVLKIIAEDYLLGNICRFKFDYSTQVVKYLKENDCTLHKNAALQHVFTCEKVDFNEG